MTATVTQDAESRTTGSDLIPISVESLRSIKSLDFDLYIQFAALQLPRLFRARNVPLRPVDLNQLLERGIETLYISSADTLSYRNYLREQVLADASLPMTKRYEILAQAARAVFQDALQARDTVKLVSLSNDLGRQISTLISGEDYLLFDLIEVMLHDYSTYAHATRVCTYASLVAKSIGIYDREQLLPIAMGSLLHDVGKVFIASQIVAKNYRITPEEREQMREHPTQGFKRLAAREDLNWGTLMMVYQHHERIDGCGYPVGLMGREIHEWARVCAVANTYDALLREHPQHDATSMARVIRNLELQCDRSLDKEITQCWIETIKADLQQR